MSENTKIEWCDHTFNGWIGCAKVSPGCANCYAERDNSRRKWNPAGWGKGVPRHRTKTWGDPVRWNKQAAAEMDDWNRHMILHGGEANYPQPRRPRVFCGSLMDWLDDEVPVDWLSDLLCLIEKTRNLDWLLLTKRPENWSSRIGAVAVRDDMGAALAKSWGVGRIPPNIWIGSTVEDQRRSDERIPVLLSIPAKIRFLSCEPLLGQVNLGDFRHSSQGEWKMDGFHWVICGGESGPAARPMQIDWARSLREQCVSASVPFLFKQWGEFAPHGTGAFGEENPMVRVGKKTAGRELDGREWNEYPR